MTSQLNRCCRMPDSVGLNVVAGTNVAGNIKQYELCQVANKL